MALPVMVKLYYGVNYASSITLTAVSSLPLSFSNSIAKEEGINSGVPVTVNTGGMNAPTLNIAGWVGKTNDALDISDYQGTKLNANTMSDIYTIYMNSSNKFKIEASWLSKSNPITNKSINRDYFIGILQSCQINPLLSYKGKEYVGDIANYTMVFTLTGD